MATVAYGVRVTEIPEAVAAELARLRAENARLLKMLELSPQQAAAPGAAQARFFDAPPDRSTKTRPTTRRWHSSGRCSRRAPTSTPPGSRTPVLAGKAGFRRCAAGGSAGSHMRSRTTCR